MIPDKLDATLKSHLLDPKEDPIPILVTFTRILTADELAALGLSGGGRPAIGTGGTAASGELPIAAIERLARRDDVHRISYRPSGAPTP